MNQMHEILRQLMNSMTTEEKELFQTNRYSYLFDKAYKYLKMGSEIYRKNDMLNQPDKNCSDEELELIKNGCQQVLKGKGLTAENPFSELDVVGFRLLFDLFHFEQIERVSYNLGDGKFVDEIKFQHLMDGSIVTYYNKLVYNF